MSKKPLTRRIIIDVEGEISSPSPDQLIGKSIVLTIDGTRVSAFDAAMKSGEPSSVTINVSCLSASIAISDNPANVVVD
jgi:hypothetical protein